VTQFDDAVKAKIEQFARTLASAEPIKVQLREAVQAAKKQSDDALVVLKRSAGIFERAQDAKDCSMRASAEAKQHGKLMTAQSRKTNKEHDSALAEVDLFRDGALAAFDELKSLAVTHDTPTKAGEQMQLVEAAA